MCLTFVIYLKDSTCNNYTQRKSEHITDMRATDNKLRAGLKTNHGWILGEAVNLYNTRNVIEELCKLFFKKHLKYWSFSNLKHTNKYKIFERESSFGKRFVLAE